MDVQAFDQDRSDKFLDRLVGMMNEASLSLMVSIGYKTGLFDRMADMPPRTSLEIAEAAELNERYVREWLGAMVTGKIVEYDPEGEHYWLPNEHAAFLTRDAGSKNISSSMGYIPVLASVEKEIVQCFHNGGGVPYEAFPHFHHVLADDNGPFREENLVIKILPVVPGLIKRLDSGIQVADIGCGQGQIGNLMALTFPKSQFVGYDFIGENVSAAETEAERLGLVNSRFEKLDIAMLDANEVFDLITAFDVIHDQARPDTVLLRTLDALKPGGIFFMVDIAASSYLHENINHPMGPFLYTVSCMHCMTVSLALDGAGLGTVWGKELATQMLYDAGFKRVDVKEIEDFNFNYYYIAYKD